MSGHEFVDTNIWLYALVEPALADDSEKHLRAARFVGQLSRPVISSQVVREVQRRHAARPGCRRAPNDRQSAAGVSTSLLHRTFSGRL